MYLDLLEIVISKGLHLAEKRRKKQSPIWVNTHWMTPYSIGTRASPPRNLIDLFIHSMPSDIILFISHLICSIEHRPMGHKRVFYDNLVIADPEIKVVDVEEDDNFVIIACDGFWDVLKFEEAVKYALDLLDDGKCAQYVSKTLCELAVRMGSSDNVSYLCVLRGGSGRLWW